jgi:hypothetical protein
MNNTLSRIVRKSLVCVCVWQVSFIDSVAIRDLAAVDRRTRMYEDKNKKFLSFQSLSEKRAGERTGYEISNWRSLALRVLLLLVSLPSLSEWKVAKFNSKPPLEDGSAAELSLLTRCCGYSRVLNRFRHSVSHLSISLGRVDTVT